MADWNTKFRALEADLRGGTLGVAAIYLPTGEEIFYNADEIFPTASVIKVAIVTEVYTLRHEGKLSPSFLDLPSVVVEETDKVGGSGILAELNSGMYLSLSDLALLAIKISDNTASNLCLRVIGGPDAVNARMKNVWGMTSTTIHRPIKFRLEPGDAPYTATGSPRDMCRLLRFLADGTFPAPITEPILYAMGTVSDGDMLPRFLDVNRYASDLQVATPPVTVAHKPGAITGVRNDAGIITRGDDKLVACIYTKDCPDTRWTAANAGCEVVAQAAKIIADSFWGDKK